MPFAFVPKPSPAPSCRAFAVAILVAVSQLCADVAVSEGLTLPYRPGGPGGEDAIDAPSGLRCRQSMNNNGAYLDLGSFASLEDDLDRYPDYKTSLDRQGDNGSAGLYARVVIPLGRRPERIDCSRLYELELRRLQMEIELMKMGFE